MKIIFIFFLLHVDPSHLEVRNQDKERDNENYELDTIVSKDRCRYCLQSPCITLEDTLPVTLQAAGPPDPRNHAKRYHIYRRMYTMLNHRGLWQDPEYLEHKLELGCVLDDVKEVMPACVVYYARNKWPNPEGIPYKGHIPSL